MSALVPVYMCCQVDTMSTMPRNLESCSVHGSRRVKRSEYVVAGAIPQNSYVGLALSSFSVDGGCALSDAPKDVPVGQHTVGRPEIRSYQNSGRNCPSVSVCR